MGGIVQERRKRRDASAHGYDGVFEVVPGIFANRSIIIGGDIYLDADQAKPVDALEAARGLFEAHFKYLLEPR